MASTPQQPIANAQSENLDTSDSPITKAELCPNVKGNHSMKSLYEDMGITCVVNGKVDSIKPCILRWNKAVAAIRHNHAGPFDEVSCDKHLAAEAKRLVEVFGSQIWPTCRDDERPTWLKKGHLTYAKNKH
ncbi:hypothetical protein LTR49_028864, partial [Elasticomyces elasticus]